MILLADLVPVTVAFVTVVTAGREVITAEAGATGEEGVTLDIANRGRIRGVRVRSWLHTHKRSLNRVQPLIEGGEDNGVVVIHNKGIMVYHCGELYEINNN